jgi:hypothetical protein
VIECLPSKQETLSYYLFTAKKERKKERKCVDNMNTNLRKKTQNDK